jgi:uncharacterized protein YndB with AHSA1/START domain
MVHVEIEETIHRPVEDVFNRLVDIPNYPNWMPDDGLFITCTKDSEGPVGLGTRYSDKTRFGWVRGEISEFEPPRRIVFHYIGKDLGIKTIEGWPGYTLEPDVKGGTKVLHVAQARLYGPFKLLKPLVQRLAQRERQRTVDALKRSLESEGS